jgi:hypothetical protein
MLDIRLPSYVVKGSRLLIHCVLFILSGEQHFRVEREREREREKREMNSRFPTTSLS